MIAGCGARPSAPTARPLPLLTLLTPAASRTLCFVLFPSDTRARGEVREAHHLDSSSAQTRRVEYTLIASTAGNHQRFKVKTGILGARWVEEWSISSENAHDIIFCRYNSLRISSLETRRKYLSDEGKEMHLVQIQVETKRIRRVAFVILTISIQIFQWYCEFNGKKGTLIEIRIILKMISALVKTLRIVWTSSLQTSFINQHDNVYWHIYLLEQMKGKYCISLNK